MRRGARAPPREREIGADDRRAKTKALRSRKSLATNEKRKRLLIEFEKIVGNEFYNGNIQNWGPGGVFECEDRALRYPVIFQDKDGKTIKTRHVDTALPAETVITGCPPSAPTGQIELIAQERVCGSS